MIFNNIVLTRKIFNHVKLIHDLKYKEWNPEDIIRVNWYGLLESPRLLARYGYMKELLTIMNRLETKYSKYRWSRDPSAPFVPYLSAIAKCAVIGGHFQIVKYIYERYAAHIRGIFIGCARLAAENNHLEILKYLYQHNNSHGGLCAFVFGRIGWNLVIESEKDIPMLEYCMHVIFKEFNQDIHLPLKNFSRKYLTVTKYLHENHGMYSHVDVFTKITMDTAAANDRLDIVRYLHENRTEGCSLKAMENAAKVGNEEMVKYLYNTIGLTKITSKSIEDASMGGHFSIVKFLVKTNMVDKCTSRSLDDAHSFEMFTYLLNAFNGVKYTLRALTRAVRIKSIPWLDFIRNDRPDLFKQSLETTDLIEESVYSGFELFQWLISAAQSGGITLSKGKYKNIMEYAASSNNMDVVKWIHSNVNPSKDIHAAILASHNNYEEMVRYLVGEGYTMKSSNVFVKDTVFEYSIKYGHLETVKFISQNRNIQFNDQSVSLAMSSGNIELLEYILASMSAEENISKKEIMNRNIQSITHTIHEAKVPMLKHIVENYPVECVIDIYTITSSMGRLDLPLEMLQFLYDRDFGDIVNQVKNTINLIDTAIYHTYICIDLLVYLCDKGAQHTNAAMDVAVNSKLYDALRFLHFNMGLDKPKTQSDIYDYIIDGVPYSINSTMDL